MSYRYCEAFAEVDYILTGLEEREREQIPKNLRDVIREKKAKNYNFNIDLTKSLFEQNLKNETLAVLALIYRKYLSDSDKRTELEKHCQETLEEPIVSNNIKAEENGMCLYRDDKIGFLGKLKKLWFIVKNKIKKDGELNEQGSL